MNHTKVNITDIESRRKHFEWSNIKAKCTARLSESLSISRRGFLAVDFSLSTSLRDHRANKPFKQISAVANDPSACSKAEIEAQFL